MLAEDLARQMVRDEKLYASEISSAITARLNDSKTQKAADAHMGTSGGWPYPPTKKLLMLYDKVAKNAWRSMEKGYSHVDVTIQVQTNADGTPYATATAKHRGAFKGGSTTVLRPGESVVSLARATYGSEFFAHDVWLANAKTLGPRCKQVPAGFGISLPQIWVPEWQTPPKASFPAGASVSAVQIMKPAIEFDLEKTKSAVKSFPAGPVIIEVTTSVSGSFLIQEKGTIDASFNLRSYKAACAKGFGPATFAAEASFKEGSKTGSLSIKMPKIPGVKGQQTVTLKPGGGLSTTIAQKEITLTKGSFTLKGTLKVDVEVKIKANPKPPGSPVTEPKPVKVDWKVVIPIVLVAGVVAVGVSVASGGTGTPAAAKGFAVVVGSALALSGS